MSGLIAALLLNYTLLGSDPAVDAAILAGYRLGPAYATVQVQTLCEEAVFAWSYIPLQVTYDFRIGMRLDWIDVGLSRWCSHPIGGFGFRDSYGLSLYVHFGNW